MPGRLVTPPVRYAHSRSELFQQLVRLDYPEVELARMRDAYEMAMRLFSGLYRPSGNTFLSHAVGTASILAHLHKPGVMVASGLLHAAYAHGDFGALLPGPGGGARRRLLAAVGPDVENAIARYTALKWSSAAIRELHDRIQDRIDALDARERDAVLLRLANELEDCLDASVAYCDNAAERLDFLRRCGPLLETLAIRLGEPGLAAELRRVIDENLAASIPGAARPRTGHARAYALPPPSYRLRLLPGVGRLYARLHRAARKRLPSGRPR